MGGRPEVPESTWEVLAIGTDHRLPMADILSHPVSQLQFHLLPPMLLGGTTPLLPVANGS